MNGKDGTAFLGRSNYNTYCSALKSLPLLLSKSTWGVLLTICSPLERNFKELDDMVY